jgi:hypothetical protein
MLKTFALRATVALCVTASSISAQQLPAPMLHSPRNVSAGDSLARAVPELAPKSATRVHHAQKGAVIGAISLGVASALVAYSQIQFGCDVSGPQEKCNVTRDRRNMAIAGGLLGAAAGAIGGGIIGALWPVHSSVALTK